MTRDPFGGVDDYRARFAAGLERLLDADSLGAFVLVLANALFEPALHQRLAPALARRYREWLVRYRDDLGAGRMPDDPPDDAAVFLKLAVIGLDALSPVTHRREGPWELQFNHLRAFRPQRASARPVEDVSAPFDPSGFHFNRPFLRREIFWSGDLLGRHVDLLYNKFPFASGHALLVPDAGAEHPQLLDEDAHSFAWGVAERLGDALPGAALAYNAYGASASVNHLHFQLCVRDAPLPVAEGHWRHNGGDVPYPTSCVAFGDRDRAWDCLADLHFRNTPYNLLYLPRQMLVLPRRAQGTVLPPVWGAGAAWYELCGGAVLFARDRYASLSAREVEAALAELAPDPSARSRTCNTAGV